MSGASDALARLSGLKARLPRFSSGRLFNNGGDAGPRRIMLLAGTAILIVAGVAWVMTSGRHAPAMSRDARMQAVDPLPGGLHSTPEQDALAVRANDQQAQAALRQGASYTPPMAPSQEVKPASPVVERATPAPTPRAPHRLAFVARQAPPTPVRTTPVDFTLPAPAPESHALPTQAARVDPAAEQLYSKQIGDLFSQWGGRAPRTEMVLPPSSANAAGDSGPAGKAVTPASAKINARSDPPPRGAPADAGGQILVPAGRGVYAHPILALSSDQTSPVVLQADSGPIVGDRMIGTFSRQDERLIIHIGSIIHHGEAISADGVVTAPDTMEASVASGVDQHYLTRFILPAAAAFVQGLGQAIATTTNTTAVLSPFGGAAYSTHLNLNQQLGVAAGAAAQQAGTVLNQSAPKGPTVTLDANVAVGVMFLSNVVAHHQY